MSAFYLAISLGDHFENDLKSARALADTVVTTMKISYVSSPGRSWVGTGAYRFQTSTAQVDCRSAYQDFLPTYRHELQQVKLVADRLRVDIKGALVCGVGSQAVEPLLVRETFPNAQRIALVDWHEANLEEVFIELKQAEDKYPGLEMALHYDDLRELHTMDDRSTDFAFANKLFDLYHAQNQDTLLILTQLNRVLRPGGLLFSLDYPFIGENYFFDQLADHAGFCQAATRIYQKQPILTAR